MDSFPDRIDALSAKKRALFELLSREKRGLTIQKRLSPRQSEMITSPLSFAQERLWFLHQLALQSSAYNIPAAVRLVGSLNSNILESSLNEIVRRHESLRTTFAHVDKQPAQIIAPTLLLDLLTIDLEALHPTEQESRVRRLVTEEAQTPFNITTGPLLRVTLLRLRQEEHILLLTVSHLIFDGWSRGVLIQELSSLYAAFITHKQSPLPELSLQYADFVLWQRQWLRGERLQKLQVYWKQQLEGIPPLLELPTDRPRPSVQRYVGATESLVLPASLVQDLKALSRQEGATLFMTLLAAFQILLHRYTGQSDIVVGSPVANRSLPETEKMMGLFANTLVLRNRLAGTQSFTEFLHQVREVTLSAYEHQDLPFDLLVELLQPKRNTSYNPLFQVLFSLLNTPLPPLQLEGLTSTLLETDTGGARFDLSLDLWEGTHGINISLEYNTDLFDAATIARMARHFQVLLEGIIAQPQQPIASLPLLTQTEQHLILHDWNQARSQTAPPANICVHQVFEAYVEQMPDAIAVVFDGKCLTYQELNCRANQLAHFLYKRGVQPGTTIGIFVDRSLEMIIGLLGILKAGGAYVPFDPSYPQERLAYMLRDAQVTVLLTQQHLVQRLQISGLSIVCLDTDWHGIQQEPLTNPICSVTADHLAYVIYTSGSTGKPKGVEICHRSVVHLFAATRALFDVDQKDTWTLVHSYAFDFSVWELWGALLQGCRLIVVPLRQVQSPTELFTLLGEEQVTILNQTPSALRQLLSQKEATGISSALLSLRLIMCGGEALPGSLVPLLLSWNVATWNFYGPTESTVWASVQQVMLAQVREGVVPIGSPISNIQLYLLDQYLNPVPIGVPGELCIGGAGLAYGYRHQPESTAEKFIPHPFSKQLGDRLYRTGDLVRYLPDGTIEFLGRIDHQVKLRGFRIELGEIETALREHPLVQDVVVMMIDDHFLEKRLVAYVLPDHEQTLSFTELRHFLSNKLPTYMLPTGFVLLDHMPLTSHGKIDRHALPSPEFPLEEEQSELYFPPLTLFEQIIMEIWSNILGTGKIGVQDNFFDLGGHSLLATQIISRIRDVLQVEIPLHCFFETPTVADLARQATKALAARENLDIPPIVKVARHEDLPLSFAQERLWVLDQLEEASSAYNIPGSLHLEGQLNENALQSTLNEIVNRHEILRTCISSKEGRPVQRVLPVQPLTLRKVDLRGLSPQQQTAEIRRLTLEETRQPFNLAQGPLLRVFLLYLRNYEHVLLFTMHHIICDAWSRGILIHEVCSLYTTFLSGLPSSLSKLDIQYADFAHWQRQWMQGEIRERHLDYWQQQLAGASVLQLPTDYPRPTMQQYHGAAYAFQLNRNLTENIKSLSNQEHVTLFMTLLSAFQILLHYYTHQDDIVIGTDIANRTTTETEKLIGFFVNQLVLRTRVTGNLTFRELLQRVREVTLGAYAYQSFPFEQIVQHFLKSGRDLSRSPLFQVKMVLQNAPSSKLEIPGLILRPLEILSETTHMDLTLILTAVDTGIAGILEYNTDLFERNTITEMVKHFELLLEEIVSQPDGRLKSLTLRVEKERKQRTMEQRQRNMLNSKSLKNFQPKTITSSKENMVEIRPLKTDMQAPLLIQASLPSLDLTGWAKNNKDTIDNMLVKYGAILFRGFNLTTSTEMETFALVICRELFADNGEHPRETMSKNIYTPISYPSHQKLLSHNENAFNFSWPTKILFCCVRPAVQGGETPIVDGRQIFASLDAQVREHFIQKKVLYLRNYGIGLGLSWQEAFQTDKRKDVEDYCLRNEMTFEWKRDDGLRTRCVRPAVIRHPTTGEMVWFNQAHLWHVSSLDQATQNTFTSMFQEEDLPRNCYYGDGTPIDDTTIKRLRDLYQQHERSFSWQTGDVMVIDNVLLSHGRNPYAGERKLLVALGDMLSYRDIQ